jgi:hypothetical protein
VREEKEIQHVICFAVSDIDELPIGPARYIRTFRIHTLLGDEFVLTLRSEDRLGLKLEREVEGRIVPRDSLRPRRTGPEDSAPEG